MRRAATGAGIPLSKGGHDAELLKPGGTEIEKIEATRGKACVRFARRDGEKIKGSPCHGARRAIIWVDNDWACAGRIRLMEQNGRVILQKSDKKRSGAGTHDSEPLPPAASNEAIRVVAPLPESEPIWRKGREGKIRRENPPFFTPGENGEFSNDHSVFARLRTGERFFPHASCWCSVTSIPALSKIPTMASSGL